VSACHQLVVTNNIVVCICQQLLCIIISKMKFEDLSSYDVEGEEEAMFLEYRKELRVIYNNLGALVCLCSMWRSHTYTLSCICCHVLCSILLVLMVLEFT